MWLNKYKQHEIIQNTEGVFDVGCVMSDVGSVPLKSDITHPISKYHLSLMQLSAVYQDNKGFDIGSLVKFLCDHIIH
jgi:hypothetical protein